MHHYNTKSAISSLRHDMASMVFSRASALALVPLSHILLAISSLSVVFSDGPGDAFPGHAFPGDDVYPGDVWPVSGIVVVCPTSINTSLCNQDFIVGEWP